MPRVRNKKQQPLGTARGRAAQTGCRETKLAGWDGAARRPAACVTRSGAAASQQPPRRRSRGAALLEGHLAVDDDRAVAAGALRAACTGRAGRR